MKKVSFNALLHAMHTIEDCPFGDAIAAAAATIAGMGDNERGSVLSTARRHTEFLESRGIQDCLRSGGLELSSLKSDPKGVTLYVVLPEWRIATHSRWLRLIISTIIHTLERTPRGGFAVSGKPFPAVLMILEEMAALGRMQAIEKAAGYIAGFGIKLVSVLQDLNQLKAHYEATWETFLGNSGVVIAYGNSDMTTTKYLSDRLGQSELTRVTSQRSQQQGSNESSFTLGHALKALSDREGFSNAMGQQSRNSSQGDSLNHSEALHKTPLMTPDEVARYFARERGAALALIAGALPIRLERLSAHRDPFFLERAKKNPFHSK